MNSHIRFMESKCDRCGKATSGKQNGIADLYALPHEWPEPLSDAGAFCWPCVLAHNEADWMQWFRIHRPVEFELAQSNISANQVKS